MPSASDVMEPLENNDIRQEAAAPSRWKGLGVRVFSALALAVIFLGLLWFGGWCFTWLCTIAALLMLREWNGLTEEFGPGWRCAGLFYCSIPCASLAWLRNIHFENQPNAGLPLVLFVMLVVWATDIGAYFTGRQVGGPKLAPAISPNKTWAGLGGGVGGAIVVSGVLSLFVPYPSHFLIAIGLGVLFGLVSQAGDLFESWMKRRAGVKDSGTLIPGHGGLLDRIDGLVFTVPLFAFFVWLSTL